MAPLARFTSHSLTTLLHAFQFGKLTERSFLIVAALIIGVLSGFGAVVFRLLIHGVQQFVYGSHGGFRAVLARAPTAVHCRATSRGGD
ncbi:MAG: hypothetical protein HYY96_17540 [Candidatus Tectomicrobia bacterium]|nr:hypothetical protein [Candidatus Tectomicrobia bacterium]